jgi:hypothetical protein
MMPKSPRFYGIRERKHARGLCNSHPSRENLDRAVSHVKEKNHTQWSAAYVSLVNVSQ